MKKMAALSIFLLLVTVVIATVASFGLDDSGGRDFGDNDFYNRKYQTWLNKRGLGSGHPTSNWGFGLPVADHHRYFNWKDYLANVVSKRQLNFGPRSFGNYRRYFTSGLQDWKSTVKGLL